MDARKTFVDNDYCNLVDSYKVCGGAFVAKHFAESVFRSGDLKKIKLVMSKSKSSLNKNSDYLKGILVAKSYSAESDELKLLLLSNDLVPAGLDSFAIAESFHNPKKVPTDLLTLSNDKAEFRNKTKEIFGTFATVDVEKLRAAFKKYPSLEKEIIRDISMNSPEDRSYQTLQLNFILKPDAELPALQASYLNELILSYQKGSVWNAKNTPRFINVFSSHKAFTNADKILMLENLVSNKRFFFPEEVFWKIFNSLDEGSLTNEQMHSLMKILFSIDDKAWAKQALAKMQSLDTYITDQMSVPCEIESTSLKTYFSDSYATFKKKQLDNILSKFTPEISFEDAEVLIQSEYFSPSVPVGGRNFLGIFAQTNFSAMTLAQKDALFRSACPGNICNDHIKAQHNGLLVQAVEKQNPDALDIMLKFTTQKRYLWSYDDERLLKRANKDSGKSREIKKIMKNYRWH